MKKFFFFISSIFLISNSVQAKVITVSNTSSIIAQYSSAQTAVDAALVNDTVYVHGSPTAYGDITINKRIVLIGAGYAPVETQYRWATTFGSISLDSVPSDPITGLNNPISGFKIIGVNVNYFDYYNSDFKKDIYMERCQVNSYLYVRGSGYQIVNSLINDLEVNNQSNCLIANNLLFRVATSNQPSVVITNNIFLPWGATQSFSTISYALITNNIFYNNDPSNASGASYSTFNNNVTVASTVLSTIPFGTNTGANNLNNTNPTFVSTSIPNNISYVSNAPLYDWNLKSTSVAKNKGTDGTDIGIYGGVYPMPNLTGASTLPQITSVNLSNSVLPSTDKLKVSFKARKVK